MIIVRLWGGLGNQMFQYAFGYSVAKRLNERLALDTRFYTDEFLKKNKRFTKQKLLLFAFNIEHPSADLPAEIMDTVSLLQTKNMNRIIRIPEHFSIGCGGNYRYFKECRFSYDEYYQKLENRNAYFDGYWQSENYFKPYRNELIKQFTPINLSDGCKELSHQMGQRNSVMIHIRRGDYAARHIPFSKLRPMSSDYYDRCIAYINENVAEPCYYVFSNDIPWVRENVKFDRDVFFVSGSDGITTVEEFWLMSQCRHAIISNSTFSWWPSWLSYDDGKIVIAPKDAFDYRGIIPKCWRVL